MSKKQIIMYLLTEGTNYNLQSLDLICYVKGYDSEKMLKAIVKKALSLLPVAEAASKDNQNAYGQSGEKLDIGRVYYWAGLQD